MDFYFLSTLLALPTLILCGIPITVPPPPLTVCKDVVVNCASLLDRCDNVAIQEYCKKSCGVCEDIPCDENGGYIGQQCHYPSYFSKCIPYKACVCKDGFLGDACEHDCKNTICESVNEPVCASITGKRGVYETFSNMCEFRAARCKDGWAHVLYEGECQDPNICEPYICPEDCSPVFYDDPNNPGCKLCTCG